jgi:hypothetical protein
MCAKSPDRNDLRASAAGPADKPAVAGGTLRKQLADAGIRPHGGHNQKRKDLQCRPALDVVVKVRSTARGVTPAGWWMKVSWN